MNKYSIILNRVIDGDSLDIDIQLGFGVVLQNKRVRIYGVDTPELRTSDVEEKKYGLMSKEFVVRWCSGKELFLVVGKDYLDKFGRVLGSIEDSNGNSLADDIISSNNGVSYFGENKELVKKAHMDNRLKLSATD